MARRNSYKYTECRNYLHAWEHQAWHLFVGKRTQKYNRPHDELVDEIVCGRCGTIRYDRYLRSNLEKIGSRYVHPRDYTNTGLVRRDFVKRMAKEGLRHAAKIDLRAA